MCFGVSGGFGVKGFRAPGNGGLRSDPPLSYEMQSKLLKGLVKSESGTI